MVNRTGLTVSLDHISFEESSATPTSPERRLPPLPYKDLFFSDS